MARGLAGGFRAFFRIRKGTMAKNIDAFLLQGLRPRGTALAGPVPGLRRMEHLHRGARWPPSRRQQGRARFQRRRQGPVGFGPDVGRRLARGRGPDGMRPVPLAKVSSAETSRLPVEPAEVARVLGGGLVEGSVVLLGGEPGVGKSTLLTGLALWWVRQGHAGDLRGRRGVARPDPDARRAPGFRSRPGGRVPHPARGAAGKPDRGPRRGCRVGRRRRLPR